MYPPHTRDLLAPQDQNFEPNPLDASNAIDEHHNCDEDNEDAMHVASSNNSTNHSNSAFSPIFPTEQFQTVSPIPNPHRELPSKPTARPKSFIPTGVSPQVISSSDTSENTIHRRPGNTTIKRKTLTGHTVVAEETKATGELMATEMREMVLCSRDIEWSKMDIQLKLFEEQMDYQREKDRKLDLRAHRVDENAKLSIMKQREVVECLSKLTVVLSAGMQCGHANVQEVRSIQVNDIPTQEQCDITVRTSVTTLATVTEAGHDNPNTNAPE